MKLNLGKVCSKFWKNGKNLAYWHTSQRGENQSNGSKLYWTTADQICSINKVHLFDKAWKTFTFFIDQLFCVVRRLARHCYGHLRSVYSISLKRAFPFSEGNKIVEWVKVWQLSERTYYLLNIYKIGSRRKKVRNLTTFREMLRTGVDSPYFRVLKMTARQGQSNSKNRLSDFSWDCKF